MLEARSGEGPYLGRLDHGDGDLEARRLANQGSGQNGLFRGSGVDDSAAEWIEDRQAIARSDVEGGYQKCKDTSPIRTIGRFSYLVLRSERLQWGTEKRQGPRMKEADLHCRNTFRSNNWHADPDSAIMVVSNLRVSDSYAETWNVRSGRVDLIDKYRRTAYHPRKLYLKLVHFKLEKGEVRVLKSLDISGGLPLLWAHDVQYDVVWKFNCICEDPEQAKKDIKRRQKEAAARKTVAPNPEGQELTKRTVRSAIHVHTYTPEHEMIVARLLRQHAESLAGAERLILATQPGLERQDIKKEVRLPKVEFPRSMFGPGEGPAF